MINSMTTANDVFGRHLLDNYHALNYPYKLGLERDDGFYDEYDGRDYFTEYREWPLIEQRAVDMAAGKVLVVGCGAGRHVLELQSRGLDVTGIDISPGAVKVCLERGVKNVKELALENVNRLSKKNFDTVLMLGANLGLLGSEEQAKLHLKRLAEITAHNAIIVGENIDFYRLKDPRHVAYRNHNISKNLLAGHFKQRLHHKDLTGEWFEYDFRSPDEMKAVTQNTPWHVNQTLGKGANYITVLSGSAS